MKLHIEHRIAHAISGLHGGPPEQQEPTGQRVGSALRVRSGTVRGQHGQKSECILYFTVVDTTRRVTNWFLNWW